MAAASAVAQPAASAAPAPGTAVAVGVATPDVQQYRLVNDGLQLFTIKQNVTLTRKLQALEQRNGTQIVFMSIESAGPDGVRAYGEQLLQKLPLGNNGDHNGVLFLIAANSEFYFFTGAGIAGALPDARLARIVQDTIEPAFKQGRHVEGILAGIDQMIAAAAPEGSAATAFTYDDLAPLVTGKRVAAVALALAGAVYAALLLRRRRQRSRLAWCGHASLLAGAALIITVLLTHKIPMQMMLVPVTAYTPAQAGNRFVAVDPARLPIAAASLAEPGLFTVLYFRDDDCGACERLDTDLADLLQVRPDVAVRKIRMRAGANGYAEAIRDYKLRIYQAPFVLLYAPDGKLIAADDGIESAGFDKLQTWIWQELMRATAAPTRS